MPCGCCMLQSLTDIFLRVFENKSLLKAFKQRQSMCDLKGEKFSHSGALLVHYSNVLQVMSQHLSVTLR